MAEQITAVLSALARPLLEPRLPDWLDVRWFASADDLLALAPVAQIGWFDLYDRPAMARAIAAAERIAWLNSIYAGVDGFPLDLLAQRGAVFTNGKGINAIAIAEFVLMGMLGHAKAFPALIRAQDQREWLADAPGKRELAGSRALILGYGAIGQLIETRLSAFDVAVDKVRRSGGAGFLADDQWRGQLGLYDWVILAVPATPETERMIGAAQLAAMKRDAVIINIARGSVIDQPALEAALADKRIGGAMLDVTTPEPLPADSPLWGFDNAIITSHVSGKAQDRMFMRSVDRFIDNLGRWERGERLEPQVDLVRGY